jgi:hypothetical protein
MAQEQRGGGATEQIPGEAVVGAEATSIPTAAAETGFNLHDAAVTERLVAEGALYQHRPVDLRSGEVFRPMAGDTPREFPLADSPGTAIVQEGDHIIRRRGGLSVPPQLIPKDELGEYDIDGNQHRRRGLVWAVVDPLHGAIIANHDPGAPDTVGSLRHLMSDDEFLHRFEPVSDEGTVYGDADDVVDGRADEVIVDPRTADETEGLDPGIKHGARSDDEPPANQPPAPTEVTRHKRNYPRLISALAKLATLANVSRKLKRETYTRISAPLIGRATLGLAVVGAVGAGITGVAYLLSETWNNIMTNNTMAMVPGEGVPTPPVQDNVDCRQHVIDCEPGDPGGTGSSEGGETTPADPADYGLKLEEAFPYEVAEAVAPDANPLETIEDYLDKTNQATGSDLHLQEVADEDGTTHVEIYNGDRALNQAQQEELNRRFFESLVS